MGICCMAQETQTGALYQPRGVGWGGRQEGGDICIPHGKEMQKSKWLSEEAFQIAVKRREAKSKGEKERYKHLNAEFQRTARRDKKTFLSE